jgi:hypothetical protein
VNLVARSSRKLEAFQQLEKASEKAGLKVNEIKMNYMLNTRNKIRCQDTENLKINNYTFQRVNEFKSAWVLVTENKEIKSAINSVGNRRYHAFVQFLTSTTLSQKTELTIYWTIN